MARMKSLQETGEDALVAELVQGLPLGREVVVGPGDDCAVIDIGDADRFQLLKTDALVEGVHYLSSTCAEQVGWKAVARVVSDFAAMGGSASQLLVTIALPADLSLDYVRSLYRGMRACAVQFGASISGGETSAVPAGSAAVISVAGTGLVDQKKVVLRRGGQVGDLVLVTGTLGGSIQGKHLSFTPRVKEADWLVSHFALHAMMDLSDGLARDLPRLADASACGYRVEEEKLPCRAGCDRRQALEDGEDYELLFTLSPAEAERLMARWNRQFPDLELTVVGCLTEAGGGDLPKGGWEHFRHRA